MIDTDKGKPNYSRKTVVSFVYHKSHVDKRGIESGLPECEAGD
jgi:hypothetical protein